MERNIALWRFAEEHIPHLERLAHDGDEVADYTSLLVMEAAERQLRRPLVIQFPARRRKPEPRRLRFGIRC